MVLSLLLALSVAHAQEAPEADPATSRIVNGQLVKGNNFPAAVALGFGFGRQNMQMCSASLLTPRVVLTAGHCTTELAAQYGISQELITANMKVFFGDDVNGANVRAVGLSEVHVHPKYKSNPNTGGVENDINVLVLAEDVDWVEPVWFRETPVKQSAAGEEVISVGYGITSSSAQSSNGVKREATLVLTGADDSFIYTNAVTNPGNTNICSGDSGGPQYAMVDGHLVQWGVHSFGFGTNPNVDLCFQQSGSTNVGSYAEFVWKNIRAVHGEDYIPQFADWDYCESQGLYLDQHCDPSCATPDEDCAMDENGDGEVDADELATFDYDGDGDVTVDEFDKGPKGCDHTGGLPARLGALLGALVVLRRRRA